MCAQAVRNNRKETTSLVLNAKQLDILLDTISVSREQIKKAVISGKKVSSHISGLYTTGMLTRLNMIVGMGKNKLQNTEEQTVTLEIDSSEKEGLSIILLVDIVCCKDVIAQAVSNKEVGIWDDQLEKEENELKDRLDTVKSIASLIMTDEQLYTSIKIMSKGTADDTCTKIQRFNVTKQEIAALYTAIETCTFHKKPKMNDTETFNSVMDSTVYRIAIILQRMNTNNTFEDVLKIRNHEMRYIICTVVYYYSWLNNKFMTDKHRLSKDESSKISEILENLNSLGSKLIGEIRFGHGILCKKASKNKMDVCFKVMNTNNIDIYKVDYNGNVEFTAPTDVVEQFIKQYGTDTN